MTTKRIIVITADDPNDVSSWSGTRYSIHRALTDNSGDAEITYVRGALPLFSFAGRAVNRLLKQLGFIVDCRYSTAYAMLLGAYLTVRLKFAGQGTLLFIAGSNELAFLRTDRRIIYISDATFRAIAVLYPKFMAYPEWLQAQGDRNEARSLSKANFIIYPSKWASESAKADYGVPSDRIFTLPFGPNIASDLIAYSEKQIGIDSELVILFVAADWKRKNGDLVVELCRLMLENGGKVRLTIIGEIPDRVKRLSFVRALGFLRKSVAGDLSILCDAFREAHFLVMPTLADATPIVFTEAQAFGVPPVSYEVGGVAGAISHGNTGLLLPSGAPAARFAEEIRRYMEDPELYAKLSHGAREHYLQKANWSNWSRLILKLASR